MIKFSDIKYFGNDGETWFDIWYSDKKSMLNIMFHNMQSDLNNGYNPLGDCIKRQLQDIERYQQNINDTLDKFTEMNDDSKIERYCYHDLLKRGVIK